MILDLSKPHLGVDVPLDVMRRDPETQTALDARADHVAAQRFAAEPAAPSCFGGLPERIGGREVTVERVGVLPAGSGIDWCACFRWNDIGDPQGYGDTREEALADLAEAWAEQIGTDEGNATPLFDAPSERSMGRA